MKRGKPQTVDFICGAILVISSVVLAWIYVGKENAFYFHDFNFYQIATLFLKQKFIENPLEALLMIAVSTSQTYNYLYTIPLLPVQAIFGETRLAFIEGVVVLYLIPYLLSFGALFALTNSEGNRLPRHKNESNSSESNNSKLDSSESNSAESNSSAPNLLDSNNTGALSSESESSFDATTHRKFWLCTFVAFLMPAVWASVLRGYPDVGAALVLNLAALLYVRDMRLSSKKQIIYIGLLLGLAPLIRRHFVYTDAAFMVALLVHQIVIYKKGLDDDTGKRRRAETDANNSRDTANSAPTSSQTEEERILAKQEKSYNVLYEGGSGGIDIDGDQEQETAPTIVTAIIRVVAVGCTAGLFLLTIGSLFTIDVLTHNYPEIYRSFHVPLSQSIEYFFLSYGVIPWIMASIGFVLFIVKDRNELRPSLFVTCWVLIDIAIWLLIASQLGIHYTLHFNAFLIIGIASLIAFFFSLPRPMYLAAPCAAFLIFNMLIGLSLVSSGGMELSSPGWLNLFERKATVPGVMFTSNYHPLIRTDKKEVFRLIKTLRELAPNKEPILVASGSDLLNDDTIRNADRETFDDAKEPRSGKVKRLDGTIELLEKQTLCILKAPYTDSEECYPLEQMLEAEVVIVPSPIQLFLEPEHQHVMAAILDCFEKNWPLAGDFEKVSQTFKLDGGVQVTLYHRVKPTSLETAVDALERIKKIVVKRPLGQPDWIGSGLSKPSSTAFDTKRDSFEFACQESENPRFLLSTESLPRGRGMYGKMGASCDGRPVVLSLKALNRDGAIAEQKQVTVAVDKEFDWTNDTDKDCYFVVIPPDESNSGNMKKDGQLILKDLSLR